MPVVVFDADGREIARLKSPRKLARTIIAGAVVLVAGDKIHVGAGVS
jgi:hypothetical protein